ncbi:MAG: DUF2905 domain-containing protein [Cytophagales bacterium]|nr:DUF2905 domain-containing protein [Cytophagales bacterium]
MPKFFIVTGIILVIIGILWPVLSKIGLGRLPGDIALEKENFKFYFPITTGIILSLLLTFILWIIQKFMS